MLAALIVAAALVLRVVVPGGFMPTVQHGQIVLTLCTGMAAPTHATAMPGMAHHDPADDAVPAAGKCAYADLAQAMTGGADAILLAAALAFILALALALDVALPPLPAGRLRPPLRGPPLAP